MRSGSISVFMRVSYSFILLLHMQYYFFAIKEYFLVMYDEIVNRSISNSVDEKLSQETPAINAEQKSDSLTPQQVEND